MTRPWVIALTGVCLLIVVAVARRVFRGADEHHPLAAPVQVASLPERVSEGGGWIARPSTGGSGAGAATGARAAEARGGRLSGPDSRGRTAGGATTLRSGRTGRQGSGVGFAARSSGSGTMQVGPVVPAAPVPFEGALPVSREAREERLKDSAVHPNQWADAQDTAKDPQNDPVLSLPLEDSTQPDSGDAPVLEKGVTFDGQGAVFSTDSQLAVPNAGNISGDAGTISFRLQPQWGGGDEGDASLVQLRTPDVWENRLQIFKNGRYLRFLFTDSNGHESNIATTIDNWQPGQAHEITATWGDAVQSFYVDGQLIGQQPYSGQLNVAPGTPLYIGSDVPKGGPSAGATLSQFQVYNRALGPGEVGTLASSGR